MFMIQSLRLFRLRTKSGMFRKSEGPYRKTDTKISPIQRIELDVPIQANTFSMRMSFSFN